MSIHLKILQIYNNLPYGAGQLAARKSQSSHSYFKKIISSLTTSPETLKESLKHITEASQEITDIVTDQNNKVIKEAENLEIEILKEIELTPKK